MSQYRPIAPRTLLVSQQLKQAYRAIIKQQGGGLYNYQSPQSSPPSTGKATVPSKKTDSPWGCCSNCGQPFTSPPAYASGQLPVGGDVVTDSTARSSFSIVSGVLPNGNLILLGHGNAQEFLPGKFHLKQRAPGVKDPAGQTVKI